VSGTWIAHGSGSADARWSTRTDHVLARPARRVHAGRIWLSVDERLLLRFANEGIWPLAMWPMFRRCFGERLGPVRQVNQALRRCGGERGHAAKTGGAGAGLSLRVVAGMIRGACRRKHFELLAYPVANPSPWHLALAARDLIGCLAERSWAFRRAFIARTSSRRSIAIWRRASNTSIRRSPFHHETPWSRLSDLRSSGRAREQQRWSPIEQCAATWRTPRVAPESEARVGLIASTTPGYPGAIARGGATA